MINILSQLFGKKRTEIDVYTIGAAEYNTRFVRINTPHMLVDVRTPAEFADGHITAAINVPLQELQQRIAALPTDKPLMLYCRTGNRSAMALQLLQSAGFQDVYNVGGLPELVAQGLPLHQPRTA